MTISGQDWVVLILFLAASGFAIHRNYTSEPARIRRALRGVLRSDVATASEGRMTKIVGVLDPVGEPLRAPLSGRPCVGYEAGLWEERGRNSRRLVREVGCADFWINDGTGTALVRMKDAKVRIHRETKKRSGIFKAPTPELEAFLLKHGQTSSDVAFGASFNKSLRYEEGVLEAGEKVAIVGFATREEKVSPGEAPGDSRYGRSKRLVLQANGDIMPLCVSDEPDVLR